MRVKSGLEDSLTTLGRAPLSFITNSDLHYNNSSCQVEEAIKAESEHKENHFQLKASLIGGVNMFG